MQFLLDHKPINFSNSTVCSTLMIQITGTAFIGTLKKAIKEEKEPALDHVMADSLTVSFITCGI
jgi:hypothetical protein